MKGKAPEILKAAKDEIQKDLILEQMKIDTENSSKYCKMNHILKHVMIVGIIL